VAPKDHVSWEQRLLELLFFRSHHGHVSVPAWPEGGPIGTWVMRQKRKKARGELAESQIKALSGAGFSWNERDVMWENQFWALLGFAQRRAFPRLMLISFSPSLPPSLPPSLSLSPSHFHFLPPTLHPCSPSSPLPCLPPSFKPPFLDVYSNHSFKPSFSLMYTRIAPSPSTVRPSQKLHTRVSGRVHAAHVAFPSTLLLNQVIGFILK
jgi:hypothetical protein